MRKFFLIAAGALSLVLTSVSMMGQAQAQPYGWGPGYGYRHHAPRRYYGPPVVYRPACVTRSVRVWNGYRWVWSARRICR